MLTAYISLNLAVVNLLPIPALDGGRLLFILIEMLRGKPIPPEKEGMVHTAGLILLLLLIVFITYQDIVRLFQ
jgi:regulator of sigma E protease